MPGMRTAGVQLLAEAELTRCRRQHILGDCSKETTFEILDYFYDQGGNFIDTSNNYQDEQSEKWIGEWMQKRACRDDMVIATKVRAA